MHSHVYRVPEPFRNEVVKLLLFFVFLFRNEKKIVYDTYGLSF